MSMCEYLGEQEEMARRESLAAGNGYVGTQEWEVVLTQQGFVQAPGALLEVY